MLKVTVVVLAVAFGGAASAADWSALRVDATSGAAFEQSLAQFKDKLSTERRQVFGQALKDIWVEGTKAAEAEQREYTAADYYRQIDGLSYEEIVTFTDPTGDLAQMRYKAAKQAARANRYASSNAGSSRGSPWPAPPPPRQQSRPPGGWGTSPASVAQAQQQCGCMYPNGPQGD